MVLNRLKKTNNRKTVEYLLAKADIPLDTSDSGSITFYDDRAYDRILTDGTLGVMESYMMGLWDSNDLEVTLNKAMKTDFKDVINGLGFKVIKDYLVGSVLNGQSIRKSKEVANKHYDLGNEFYNSMLGPKMQYTCARFRNGNETLDQAQLDKMDLTCNKAYIHPNDKIIETGNGWGMLSKHMAEKFGCNVTAYNNSGEQVKYGNSINNGQVAIHEDDYRRAKGEFDKFISVGMLEHVGPKNYRNFFKLIDRLIPNKGLAVIHTITSDLQKKSILKGSDKYIFPGGVTPAVFSVRKAAKGILIEEDIHNSLYDYNGTPTNYKSNHRSKPSQDTSMNYSKTLKFWYENYKKNFSKFKDEAGETFVRKFGHIYPGELKDPGKIFERMEDYYLLGSKVYFDLKMIHLTQFVFSKGYKKGEYQIVR